MDYKKDLRLDEIEKELIDIVVNYEFVVDYETICFKDIIDKVELDTSVPEYFKSETLNVKELAESLELAKTQAKKFHEERKAILDKVLTVSSDEERKLLYERSKHLEIQMGQIGVRINNIEIILENKGIIKTPLLGCFVPNDKKVYLYLDNIERVSTISSRPQITIYTLIHEMFHAWNYFKSGGGRSVMEIDEPMTELYSLLFLEQLVNVNNAFNDILISACSTIARKRTAVGFLASYGFGYFLFEQSKIDEDVLKMVVKYSGISSSIDQYNPDVKNVKALLNPYYPLSEEEYVLTLFKKLILCKGVRTTRGITKGEWKNLILDIVDIIQKVHGSTFTLDDIYPFRSLIQRIFPFNNNIEAKIRQQLQDLCRDRVIERVRPGVYRIL